MTAFSAWAEPDRNYMRKDVEIVTVFLLSKQTNPKEGRIFFTLVISFIETGLKGFLQSPIVIRKMAYVPDPDYPGGKV